MPITINLNDIPSGGQSVACEISPLEMALPSDDGKILESLSCVGQVLMSENRMAHFQGKLTGRIARECVRCLTILEEDLCLSCEANFCQTTAPGLSQDTSKKRRKGRRKPNYSTDEDLDHELDSYPITDNQIDLLPALREGLILATPSHPLCQESCAGLCQVCGANLNEAVCECYSPVTPSSLVDKNSFFVVKKQEPKSTKKLEQIRT